MTLSTTHPSLLYVFFSSSFKYHYVIIAYICKNVVIAIGVLLVAASSLM